MAKLSVDLTQTQLVVQSGDSCNGSSSGSSPSYYDPQIGSARKSADSEIGQRRFEFASPAAFVALPTPSTLTGRLLYLRSISGDDLDVRVTHATQGATVYPVASKGMLLLEPSDDEGISLVEVQGTGVIEWSLSGDLP